MHKIQQGVDRFKKALLGLNQHVMRNTSDGATLNSNMFIWCQRLQQNALSVFFLSHGYSYSFFLLGKCFFIFWHQSFDTEPILHFYKETPRLMSCNSRLNCSVNLFFFFPFQFQVFKQAQLCTLGFLIISHVQ